MVDEDPSTGNLHVEPAGPPPGAPPGAVSEHRLDDVAIEGARDRVRAALPNLPALPEVPTWVFVVGAAMSASVAYAAWRVLKASAPVLLPAALGVPPGTTQVLQQIAARRPALGEFGPMTAPMTEPMSRVPSAALAGLAATIPGTPLGAGVSNPDVASILALLPALGGSSATAAALQNIASNVAANVESVGRTRAAASMRRASSSRSSSRAPVSSSDASTLDAPTLRRPASAEIDDEELDEDAIVTPLARTVPRGSPRLDDDASATSRVRTVPRTVPRARRTPSNTLVSRT